MHLSVEATPGACFAHKEFISLLGRGGEPGVQEHTEFIGGVLWRGMALQKVPCPPSRAVHTLGLPQGSSDLTGAAGRSLGASVPGYTLLLLCEQCPNCASFLAGKIMTIGKQLVIM